MTIILDGTTGITTPAINSSGDLELPGGTANGVLYLNGSNVATSGSAFVFDGTNLGVGTTSPGFPLQVVKAGVTFSGNFKSIADFRETSAAVKGMSIGYDDTSQTATFISTTGAAGSNFSWVTWNGSAWGERARITDGGNLLVGTTSISGTAADNRIVGIYGAGTSNRAQLRLVNSDTGTTGSDGVAITIDTSTNLYVTQYENASIVFETNGANERARITAAGNFGLGTSSPACLLHVNGAAIDDEGLVKISNTHTAVGVFYPALNVINTRGDHSYGNVATFSIASSTDTDRPSILIYSGQAAHSWQIGMISTGWGTNDEFGIGYRASNTPGTFSSWPTRYFSIATNGNVSIPNALSKGSGSFKIDHPLKPDTHHLVHSFIEGPQADLIYRGKATLVNGKATINIDSAAGMTEGTFVALCREVQCFTSNESDWDAVRGSVSGNALTIECQNPNSSATISWMVIGERQDKHMYDTDWTDENGKVIVEPEKQLN